MGDAGFCGEAVNHKRVEHPHDAGETATEKTQAHEDPSGTSLQLGQTNHCLSGMVH